MHFWCLFLVFSLLVLSPLTSADTTSPTNTNPNVWNFQIARKVIAAFQFNGMGMSIWEDQGVENSTVVLRRQFYVTPITEFLPNETKCEYNDLTGANFVSFSIQVWNERLQLAAVDRLREMQIDVNEDQVQPLPFYQVRVIWNSATEKLQKAKLNPTWNNNLQQQSIHRFKIFTDDKTTCEKISTTLQNHPDLWTDSIALEYSLSAASTASRILTVKTDHFLNSQLMATLKNMDVKTPERFLTSDDANRLSQEIMDNVIATQVVDGEYVPDADQLTLKDVVTSSLQLVNTETGNFSQKMWESVFWDPVYARPDKVTSYLNKVLKINQGNHTVTKTSSYSDKDEDNAKFGLDKIFSFGGGSSSQSSSSASFADMQAWFLEHNYDVEIQGEIFIPKNLSLKRLNLGILNRQETIFTKSVQMQHVDAPGILKVTAGSKAVVSIENDDIKRLRGRLDKLAAAEDQDIKRLSERLDKLAVAEDQDIRKLKERLDKFEPQVENAIAELAKNISTYDCVTQSSAPFSADVWWYIEYSPINCPGDRFLKQIQLTCGDNRCYYNYVCC